MPSAYKRDYDLLKRFEKSSDFHGAEDLVAVCRAMRQVLEGYLRAKYPSSWGDTAWLGVMIEEIAGAGSDDKRSMIKHLLPELDQLNAFHKRHYHAGDGPGVADIDPREVLQYVRQTIDVISR